MSGILPSIRVSPYFSPHFLPLSFACQQRRGGQGVRFAPYHTAQLFTTTVPVMNGWIAQWYVNVPA